MIYLEPIWIANVNNMQLVYRSQLTYSTYSTYSSSGKFDSHFINYMFNLHNLIPNLSTDNYVTFCLHANRNTSQL